MIEHELRTLHSTLCETFPTLFHKKGYRSPDNNNIENSPLRPDSPVNFVLPTSENGLNTSANIAYKIFNTALNIRSPAPNSHWHTIGYITSTKLNWNNIYQLPTSKKEGDTQFRLNHNILPSLTVLHHMNPDIPSMCGWCGGKGTIEHLFIRCPQIQATITLLYKLLDNLLPDVELTFEMYWTLVPHAKGRSREAVRLANNLIIRCKNVIYHLYRY